VGRGVVWCVARGGGVEEGGKGSAREISGRMKGGNPKAKPLTCHRPQSRGPHTHPVGDASMRGASPGPDLR